jgi:hypothetical protein
MADMMYFMGQNKKKEATKQKEREDKAKLKDVNMAAPSFDRKILNDQHQRGKDEKAKVRAQPKENAKFDMAVSLFSLVHVVHSDVYLFVCLFVCAVCMYFYFFSTHGPQL